MNLLQQGVLTMKKKKKRDSKIPITCCCLFFFVLFFIFQFNPSSLSRSKLDAAYSSNNNPGSEEHLKLKTVFKQNPLLLPRPQPPHSRESPQLATQISCDRTQRAYDLCKINGPTLLDPTISTFYLVDPQPQNTTSPPYTVEKIRPYPRKWESFTMSRIKELTLTSGPPKTPCQVHHNVPALVFSAGAYTGNFFHDFNDGLIPLFITVKSVFSDDQDFIFAISKARDWWVSKYADLLQTFSKHPIINLDNDTSTHCFPSARIGLVSHGFMTINSKLLPSSQSFTHFHALLNRAYGRTPNIPSKFNSSRNRPRLVIMGRSERVGRVLLNQNEVKNLAQSIGFDVEKFEPTPRTPLREAYELINSSHALIGVHGAALTHALFLRPGSVFLQVVPLGIEKVAEICFGNLGRGMGLEYMEYKIGIEESSLVNKYDKNSLLIKDPVAYQGKNWSDAIMNIYLKEQNVRLDSVRFGEYLNKTYEKAKKFMDREG